MKYLSGKDGATGGRGDAKRHCFLACCMAKVAGKTNAPQLLNDYERRNQPAPGNECQTQQDHFSNGVGACIGARRDSC